MERQRGIRARRRRGEGMRDGRGVGRGMRAAFARAGLVLEGWRADRRGRGLTARKAGGWGEGGAAVRNQRARESAHLVHLLLLLARHAALGLLLNKLHLAHELDAVVLLLPAQESHHLQRVFLLLLLKRLLQARALVVDRLERREPALEPLHVREQLGGVRGGLQRERRRLLRRCRQLGLYPTLAGRWRHPHGRICGRQGLKTTQVLDGLLFSRRLRRRGDDERAKARRQRLRGLQHRHAGAGGRGGGGGSGNHKFTEHALERLADRALRTSLAGEATINFARS